MKKHNYIFTNKKHSHRAMMSVILGLLSVLALSAAVFLAYLRGGETPEGFGYTGFLAEVFSLIGLILGVITVQDRRYYKFFPGLGILLNLIALGGVALILYMA